MRGRFWLPCLGLALIGAAACSLAIGKADLTAVHCEQEGNVGAPSCDEGQICLQGVCTDCSVAGNCSGGGGAGGAGGEGGTGGGEGGTGGEEAGLDVNQGGSAGTGGVTHDSGTGGASPDVGSDLVEEPPPPDVVQEPPVVPNKLGEGCAANVDCESGLFCVKSGTPYDGVCSRTCCSSSDTQCAAGFVCVPALAGGICVAASKLSLTLGVAVATAPCSTPQECRSGRCDLSNSDGGVGTCIDMCCSDGDCSANGGNCSFLPYKSTAAWQCAVWTTKHGTGYSGGCGADEDCKANSCVQVISMVCSSPCCVPSDCSKSIGSACGYFMEGSVALRECYGGATPSCCTNQQCATNQVCAPLWTDVPTGKVYPATAKAWVLRCQ